MNRKKNKKKILIIALSLAAVLIVVLVIGLSVTSGSEQTVVKVQSVSTVCATGSISGVSNVYAGVVQSQETVHVNADSSYKIDKTYVSEGDTVKKGDNLFTYDLSENSIDLRRAKLELEKLNTNTQTINEQIAQLIEQRDEASESQKYDLTTQLLEAQSNLKQNQYDIEEKQLEIDNLEETAANATVKAPISGIITAVGSLNSNSQSEAYISILATGDYRIEGTINEQNIDEIKAGDKMSVHSRNGEEVWYGTVSEIDTENPVEQNGSSVSESSNYNFYIALDSAKGLMLGQHVYCEKDLGLSKDGKIQLPVYYIVNADSKKPYVWVQENGKIAKRYVTLGSKDESTNCYVIESGISLKDYIAYPDSSVKAGRNTEVAE